MMQALDQSILELLHASRDDEETLHLPVNNRTFGFHAQQATEKLLKALIAGHDERYAFTHNLASLVEHCSVLGEQLPGRLDLVESLTIYAGAWRYQVPGPIAVEQREELVEIVAALRAFTLSRLNSLRPSVDWLAIE